jgi:hypothetical protein
MVSEESKTVTQNLFDFRKFGEGGYGGGESEFVNSAINFFFCGYSKVFSRIVFSRIVFSRIAQRVDPLNDR